MHERVWRFGLQVTTERMDGHDGLNVIDFIVHISSGKTDLRVFKRLHNE